MEASPPSAIRLLPDDHAAAPATRLADEVPPLVLAGAASVITTCANCGARMVERKCKLICACGYFLSCSDYY